MCKKETQHLFWRFLRHPLLVACVSTGVFGLVVALLGTAFQHSNWDKQDRISRERTQQEKLFDKRSELAAEIFYYMKKRETNAWSLYSACNFPDKMNVVKYWDKRQEIICEETAVRQKLAIYFGLTKKRDLIKKVWQVHEMWSKIEKQLAKYPERKNITEEVMYQKSAEASQLEDEIIEILKADLYK